MDIKYFALILGLAISLSATQASATTYTYTGVPSWVTRPM